jgi:hypothetical protein
MGCCNEVATTLDTAAVVDATQHVNFAKGMVLGVDDFRQEFAYLSGRDQWLVRDAVGYGTASGLRVFYENDGTDGPRLHVTAGSAFVPSGKHVCVGADQCAVINKWLAKPKNAAMVTSMVNGGSPVLSPPPSPPVTSATISLFLTLCYQDCLTRPVPVPGEPCRSQDELMADSRVADDYRLELRQHAPVQVEEDALRDFVRWLRANVQVGDTSPPQASDDASWLAALRPAAQAWLDAASMSPPLSPPPSFSTLGDYLVDLPPLNLTIRQEQVCDFLRVAFGFWVTELRPLWMASRCHRAMLQDQDCVLLARVEFEVEFIGGSPTGTWQIAGTPVTVVVDETTRPFLVHLRLLQEWLLCGCDCGGLGLAAAQGSGGAIPDLPPGPLFVRSGAVHTPVPVSKTNADLVLDDRHYFVIGTTAPRLTLTLPVSLPENVGQVFVIKNADVGRLTVRPPAIGGNTIDDKGSILVKKKSTVTVIADGDGGWHVIGKVA